MIICTNAGNVRLGGPANTARTAREQLGAGAPPESYGNATEIRQETHLSLPQSSQFKLGISVLLSCADVPLSVGEEG